MGRLLWQPSPESVKDSRMHQFMTAVNDRYGTRFSDYSGLYDWSISHLTDFYECLWGFLDIKASRSFDRVIDDPGKMPGARWFEGAELNFAENLLRYRDERTAIVFKGEGQPIERLSYADLVRDVGRLSAALRDLGVVPGDRVVGFMPNMPQTICAMLAAVSVGATWSSCSPDFGIKGVLDRFGQIRPKVIFAADGYWFKGKRIDAIERLGGILDDLPSIERVVVVPYTRQDADLSALPNAVGYDAFGRCDTPRDMVFAQLPFEHPLYIMYSSGTTGLPKCMVQSAGGILVHQMKELALHTDLKRDDVIFYFTTCGWMMWNWLTCALSTGATLVLFDGNPFYPGPAALWDLAQEVGITVFGTSAGYLNALETSGLKPRETHDLSALRTILSTGSPLSEEGFEFVYRDIKSDLQLASISG
ncbi:MAG: acetoacetate--CoA ligase, partial [Desulfobacterales bacterium]